MSILASALGAVVFGFVGLVVGLIASCFVIAQRFDPVWGKPRFSERRAEQLIAGFLLVGGLGGAMLGWSGYYANLGMIEGEHGCGGVGPIEDCR